MNETINLIMVDNNEDYEDNRQICIGFVETREEAISICERLKQESREDSEKYDQLTDECFKRHENNGCTEDCKNCELNKAKEIIEAKPMHRCCYHPGNGSIFYREVPRIQ